MHSEQPNYADVHWLRLHYKYHHVGTRDAYTQISTYLAGADFIGLLLASNLSDSLAFLFLSIGFALFVIGVFCLAFSRIWDSDFLTYAEYLSKRVGNGGPRAALLIPLERRAFPHKKLAANDSQAQLLTQRLWSFMFGVIGRLCAFIGSITLFVGLIFICRASFAATDHGLYIATTVILSLAAMVIFVFALVWLLTALFLPDCLPSIPPHQQPVSI
jgi:hypothetical protein